MKEIIKWGILGILTLVFIGFAPDTFETVESPSALIERVNEDGTISGINITRNGDIIISVRGFSYIGEFKEHELVFTRDWQGSAEESAFGLPDTGYKAEPITDGGTE